MCMLCLFRSRRPVNFVYWRVWRRQDGKHEKSDSIFGIRCCIQAQVDVRHAHGMYRNVSHVYLKILLRVESGIKAD